MRPAEGRANTADIICIGAQRAMTTWLHGVVSADPRCWSFPDSSPLTGANKEARFWPRNRARGIDWYRCLLTPPENRARLSLDFSPDYALMGDSQIAEARQLSPTAKVVYLLRDPLARALSVLRIFAMRESSNAPADELVLKLDDTLRERASRARLWAHGDYAAIIRRWQRHFPDLIVVNCENLASDPVQGALALLNRLGLDPYALPEARLAALTERAKRKVWASTSYRASPDLVHWLHGSTWRARQRLERENGIAFTEFDAILKRAANLLPDPPAPDLPDPDLPETEISG